MKLSKDIKTVSGTFLKVLWRWGSVITSSIAPPQMGKFYSALETSVISSALLKEVLLWLLARQLILFPRHSTMCLSLMEQCIDAFL